MNNYELYNKVLSTLNEDEGSFNAAARNWIENVDASPFKDEQANELFNAAIMHRNIWRSNSINSRVSKRRMIKCVREIVEKNIPNPYNPKEIVKEKEEIKEEPKPEIKNEKKIVLGVPNGNFNTVYNQNEKTETKEQEQKEEIKDEKHFFGKRKPR